MILENKKCSVDNCDRSMVCRTYCRMHYVRWKRNGTTNRIRTPKRAHVTALRSPRQCKVCQTEFVPYGQKHIYCSTQCKDRSIKNDPQLVNCLVCNSSFLSNSPSQHKYCSIKCRHEGKNKRQSTEKYSKYQSEYRKRNNRSVLKHRLKNWYGITIEQYDAMIISQGNKCFICSDTFESDIKPCVDHKHHGNHSVRKILCSPCNLGLGGFKDNPDLLIKAAEYLRQFS